MRNSCKSLLISFLLLVNIYTASSNNDIISINFSENLNSEKILVPTINVNSSNLNSFSTCFGTASQQQSFTVSGSDLINNIIISVPSVYEISLNGTTWSSSLILALDGSGNVNSTIIFIRIAANAGLGAHNVAVAISSGSVNQDITGVSGIVNNLPSISGTSNVCVGSTLQLTGSGTGAIANPWISSTSNVTIDSTGLITGISSGGSVITYVDSNGCSDTESILVNGLPNSTISTSNPVTFCFGGSVLLTANSGTGLTHVWKKNGIVIPSQTNQTYNATTSGDYTVTVTNSSGCSSTSSITVVTVNPIPVVDFTFVDNQCSGSTIQFNTNSIGVTYTWNFGDSTSSTLQNPNHIYNSSGCGTINYQVSLTIIDANGCSNTTIKTITIKQAPNATFKDASPGVTYNPLNLSNQFNNCQSAGSANPIYNVSVAIHSSSNCISNYIVNWGDGSSLQTFTSAPFTHSYTALGAFTMSITATGNNGCSVIKNYIIHSYELYIQIIFI